MNPLVSSGLDTRQWAEAFRRGLSSDDLQDMADPVVLSLGQYIAAERDDIDLTTEASRHVTEGTDEILALMRESSAYDLLLEREIEPRVREVTGKALAAVQEVQGWAIYLFGTREDAEDQMAQAFMRSVTADWLEVEVEQGIDEFLLYLVGDSDSFEINVRLNDAQTAIAVQETKAILQKADSHDLLFTGVVERQVKASLGESVAFPYGVEITSDEVVGVLREAARPAWVKEQVDVLIDDVGRYVTGRSDQFSTEVSLTLNKIEAGPILADNIMSKVAKALDDLPVCTTEAEVLAFQNYEGPEKPRCIPAGVSVSDILEENQVALAGSVQVFIHAEIPDEIVFDESQLRSALRQSGGPQVLASFDELRGLFKDGWTYDRDGLRADLSGYPGILRLLDGTRSYLSEGHVHKYGDRSAGAAGNQVGTTIDEVREWGQAVRRYDWAVYLTTSVLLVAVGLVLGRSWSGRIGWAALVLLAAAAAAYALAGPAYQASAGEAFEQVRDEAAAQAGGPFRESTLLAAGKLVDVVEAATSEFMTIVSQSSLIIAVVAFVMLSAVIIWRKFIASSP